MLLFIGAPEVIFILFAVLLLFGSKKIPEVARGIGKGYREFQKASNEFKRELSDIAKNDPISNPKDKSEPIENEAKAPDNH
jgi:TatA/E family protein of Tat protein translocase